LYDFLLCYEFAKPLWVLLVSNCFLFFQVILFFSGFTLSSSQEQQVQQPVRLRRRLSDKDKERRLVRRSSSKRKDKENGGSSTSLDPQGSSGALASTPATTISASTSEGIGGGPRDSVARAERGSRSGSLKRTGSAEASSSSPRGSSHAILCRTGSQDTPTMPAGSSHVRSIGSTETLGSESSLTRSLPRI
jgi:hypothetical protein